MGSRPRTQGCLSQYKDQKTDVRYGPTPDPPPPDPPPPSHAPWSAASQYLTNSRVPCKPEWFPISECFLSKSCA